MKTPRNTRIYGFSVHNGMEPLYTIDRGNYLDFVT
jgi:hypothetical protein